MTTQTEMNGIAATQNSATENSAASGSAGNTASTLSTAPNTQFAAADPVVRETLGSDVLERLLPEYRALDKADFTVINVDIPHSVSTVLGALKNIRPFRAQIASAMPSFDLSLVDKLEDYCIAVADAHASYLAATQPSDELKAVIAEATASRETLLSDARALVTRGLLDGSSLDKLQGAVGHENLAVDLSHLVKLLRGNFPRFAGKSAVNDVELVRAARVYQSLYRLLGEKEQVLRNAESAADLRQRAYTCFFRAYDHTRRAISFLRWNEDDVDKFAPSLFTRRGKRKGGTDGVIDAVETTPSPLPPSPAAPHVASASVTAPITGPQTSEPFLR